MDHWPGWGWPGLPRGGDNSVNLPVSGGGDAAWRGPEPRAGRPGCVAVPGAGPALGPLTPSGAAGPASLPRRRPAPRTAPFCPPQEAAPPPRTVPFCPSGSRPVHAVPFSPLQLSPQALDLAWERSCPSLPFHRWAGGGPRRPAGGRGGRRCWAPRAQGGLSLQYEPIVTEGNEALVHHMEVFQCAATFESFPHFNGPCDSKMKPERLAYCRHVLAAWALGAKVRSPHPRSPGLPTLDPLPHPGFPSTAARGPQERAARCS